MTAIAEPVLGRHGSFVSGAEAPDTGGRYRAVVNPADGSLLAEVADGTPEVVDRAVAAAVEAARVWKSTAPARRGRILLDIAAAIRADAEAIARAETLDNGKPLSQAASDVESAARYFEFFGGYADKFNGDAIPLGQGYVSYTIHEPFGVVGHILPWNAPLQQAARGIAPCLAAGNAVVAKPSEETPLSTLRLARIAVECGLPAGVFNVITGTGAEVGAALCAHPDVRRLAFTGSVATGRVVAAAAADRVIPSTLELGGKSANIVFADADLDEAVAGAVKASMVNAGQICSAGTRLLVDERISARFVERLTAVLRGMSVGPGIDDPDIGAITTRDQFAKVKRYIEIAEAEGATAIRCGRAVADRPAGGFYVDPVVFVEVRGDMTVAREEVFGPVLSVQTFRDEQEAVTMANDSEYGLAAGVWTADIGTALRVARDLEVGQVFVNEYFAGGVETPFGGVKRSGYGREKGLAAMYEYTQSKAVNIRIG